MARCLWSAEGIQPGPESAVTLISCDISGGISNVAAPAVDGAIPIVQASAPDKTSDFITRTDCQVRNSIAQPAPQNENRFPTESGTSLPSPNAFARAVMARQPVQWPAAMTE